MGCVAKQFSPIAFTILLLCSGCDRRTAFVIGTENMREKQFAVPGNQIQRLVDPMGGCFATDRIMVDGSEIRYFYREEPDSDQDSGWRFFAGDESQEYADDPANISIYEVNTVANYDRDIIPYLETPPPCTFEKLPDSDAYERVDE